MSIDVYIVRQGTPESRLLAQLGFERRSLQVAEWQGRRRSKGGFGRRPVAWRISGQREVETLCSGLVRILGEKNELTPEEEATLNRAQQTLATLRKRQQRARKRLRRELLKATAKEIRDPIVDEYLTRRLPLASQDEIDKVLEEVLDDELANSVDDLMYFADVVLSGKPAIWNEARSEVIAALMPGA
ncbi:MAG: hypothetical protein DWQ41_13235 [Planctomycetota bacterium]|nr:MAG: hypothetical protein DWQ41_13235 [Planctomycetota bacterium]